MRPSVRTANRRRASVGQIILAMMLLLVLLTGVAPFGSLASHRCQMACCISKSPHAEGSCSVAFMSEETEEATAQDAEHSAHQHAHHSSAQQSSSRKETSQTASVAAQIITTPCSPECAAAAAASTQPAPAHDGFDDHGHTRSTARRSSLQKRFLQNTAAIHRTATADSPACATPLFSQPFSLNKAHDIA